jgi:hypothetical protein
MADDRPFNYDNAVGAVLALKEHGMMKQRRMKGQRSRFSFVGSRAQNPKPYCVFGKLAVYFFAPLEDGGNAFVGDWSKTRSALVLLPHEFKARR